MISNCMSPTYPNAMLWLIGASEPLNHPFSTTISRSTIKRGAPSLAFRVRERRVQIGHDIADLKKCSGQGTTAMESTAHLAFATEV